MHCIIKFLWDDESKKWHCESDDVPGLLLESASCDVLIKRVCIATPEMLALNCNYTGPIQLSFETNRSVTVDGKIEKRHMANAIMKQAGIKHKF